MQHGLFTYPWDLADHGYDTALGEIAEAGFTNVNLAMQYHNGKFLLPRNPNQRVYFAEDGAIHYRPDLRRYGAMTPRVHSLVTESTSPAEELAKRCTDLGLKFVAWTVCNHNRWLGEQFPLAVQHTAFGDPLYNSLSPAHPLVREYLVAHVADMASQFELRAIMLESPGYMGFQHGEHHEIIGTEFDAMQRDLLNLSFSDFEVMQAGAEGIPAQQLRGRIADLLDASMNSGKSITTAVITSLDDLGLAAYRAWLNMQELTLATEIRKAVKAVNPSTKIWHFANLDGSSHSTAIMGTGDTALAGYADSDDDAGTRAQKAAEFGKPVRGAIRAIAPDTTSAEQIAPRLAAWAATGVSGVDVYNYGLMNGVIWNAVKDAMK